MTNPVQISDNCWKHIDKYGSMFYIKTYYDISEYHRENELGIEIIDGIEKIGSKFYYFNFNNCLHREDGPAAEYINGSKEWYFDGFLHRRNGPAVEFANGNTLWYYKGTEIPFKKNLKLLKKK